jgi:programmed cell death protein 5
MIGEQIENQLIMLAQSGRLQEKITDAQLRELLQKIMPKKRDINIKRRY